MSAPQAATLMIGGDPYISLVKFLWHADGTNGQTPIYTPSIGTNISAQGPAQGSLSTTQARFGPTSFASSTDNIRAATSATYTIGTVDFVIEYWVYFTAVAATMTQFDTRPASTNGLYPTVSFTVADGLCYVTNSAIQISSGVTPSTNIWSYIALARESSVTRLYYGTTAGSTAAQAGSDYADSHNYMPASTGIYLARSSFPAGNRQPIVGFLDEVRFTVGTSRGYNGATIPVPTAPFPST